MDGTSLRQLPWCRKPRRVLRAKTTQRGLPLQASATQHQGLTHSHASQAGKNETRFSYYRQTQGVVSHRMPERIWELNSALQRGWKCCRMMTEAAANGSSGLPLTVLVNLLSGLRSSPPLQRLQNTRTLLQKFWEGRARF